MRPRVLLASLGAALAFGPSTVRADSTYEMMLRTQDALVGGTAELEARIIVSVKGDRMRQEATGSRTMVTRRGARYQKPGPSPFAMTFDLCLAPDVPALAEARALEERIGDLTGTRGQTQDRELRVFAHRRDVFAVFELMHRLLEREQHRLGGVALRWEWVFSGPRRDEAQATLIRHLGEVTRIERGWLDASGFELPSGLTRDPRSSAARSLDKSPRPMLYLALPGEQLLKRPSRGGPT